MAAVTIKSNARPSKMAAAVDSSAARSSALFEPLTLRGVTLRNRIVVGPMMQYSAPENIPGRWHLVHLTSRGWGGAGAVFVEATAVEPRGRSTLLDTGLWNNEQEAAFSQIAQSIAETGALPAIQIVHSGRKGSIHPPWGPRTRLSLAEGGWQPVAPSAITMRKDDAPPHALSLSEIDDIITAFGRSAERARRAGFKMIEIHGAHGYLAHQFLSPFINHRDDAYGGDFKNRSRFLLSVVRAVRAGFGEDRIQSVRLSAQDGVDGGWSIADTKQLVPLLQQAGADLIDVSSGGITPGSTYPQTTQDILAYADELRSANGPALAVGWHIDDPKVANAIVAGNQADLVLLAKAMIRDPYWPHRAAFMLGALQHWPQPYAPGQWR